MERGQEGLPGRGPADAASGSPGLRAGTAGHGEDDARVLVRQRRGPPDCPAH